MNPCAYVYVDGCLTGPFCPTSTAPAPSTQAQPQTLDPATLAALVAQLSPGQTLEIELEPETKPHLEVREADSVPASALQGAAASPAPAAAQTTNPQTTLQALIERLRQPSPALEKLRQALSQPTNALTQELETLGQQANDLAQALQTLLKRIKPAPDGSVDAG